jgi:hypothetical protein
MRLPIFVAAITTPFLAMDNEQSGLPEAELAEIAASILNT